jgi:hypothetical protein
MSSSRSIAAARQKRAGEQSSNTNNNSGRPITSISSSSVFSQQPQQSRQSMQQGNIKYNQSNSSQARQMSAQGQNKGQPPSTTTQKQLAKISVSDAIGLITLRLGKLEQFIQNSLEDGGLPFNNNNNNNNSYSPDNMKLVSDEVFENITNRLENLETKNNTTVTNTIEQITKINKDVKDIKDSINTLNMKLSSFMSESQDRFMDFEAALVEIEKSLDFCNNGNEGEQVEQDENIDIDTENYVSETIEESVNTNDFNVENYMQDE